MSKEVLINDYVARGLNWEAGAITLGMSIPEAKRIVTEYRREKSLAFSANIDNKMQMLIDSIDDDKVYSASLGEVSKAMRDLHHIKRLEMGESTENVSMVSRILEEMDD